jgi:hypothetical protein
LTIALSLSCVAAFRSPATKIAIYIDGELTTGDPGAIQLTDHCEIAIVIGTPPPQIPKSADFSNAGHDDPIPARRPTSR